jgi:D-beta-D-heptose 7-phosphate kinase/D-beta-D-heptose 1-phosphate adenosyltransferase
MKTVVLLTGGFDPIHSGHASYIKSAKQLGDILVVGANSDQWLAKKKGSAFMPLKERTEILRNIIGVDFVIDFDDADGSAKHAIYMVRQSYPRDRIIFANGGDRTSSNIPEMDIEDDNLEFAFGVGGEDKKNSSSWILQEWKAPKTERQWGYYRVLHEDGPTVKLKELTVDPGKSLSMQKHEKRSEFWFVTQGIASVYTLDVSTDIDLIGEYHKNQHIWIDNGQWHQLRNETDRPLKLIEIQYGESCVEEDIERKQNVL